MVVTSFVFAHGAVEQLDDINRDLEQIKKELLKDVGSDTAKDTSPREDADITEQRSD